MLIKNIFTLFFLSLSFSASAHSNLEPLIGHFATPAGVHIQVRSGGCSFKEQFHVEDQVAGEVHHLRFVRDQYDMCRAYLPYGEILTFSFEELGLRRDDQFVIANPSFPGRVLGF